jgi:hypothetical protein
MGSSKHSKIIQNVTEQHIGKALNQGTSQNSHIVHFTHTAVSTNIKVQNIQHGK